MDDQTVKQIILSVKGNYQASTKAGKKVTLDHLVAITKRGSKASAADGKGVAAENESRSEGLASKI